MPYKRNMDLVRDLLLYSEEDPAAFDLACDWEYIGDDGAIRPYDSEVVRYHLRLLEDAGYISEASWVMSGVQIQRLSWSAHDFLDAVRDNQIWEKTKGGALAAGGFTFDLIKDIAKGMFERRSGKSLK